ncbi:MAG TPA: CBS domain-containing protein [Burkholderiales bacterium]|nr:CBS domain-containing protein [Burkholderiales bacterium]
MERSYAPLPSHGMEPGTTFQQPVLPEPRRVGPDDPALEVMTDFRQVRAITVAPGAPMDYARQRMRANGVHLLLVVDERNVLLGLITSTDIEGDKPVRLVHDRDLRRAEITVGDVMTPRERLEVIPIEAVRGAHVGHVVATLKAVGRQHAMVVDRDAHGRQRVRGLFAVSQLNRQLGSGLQPLEVARSFAEVETALGSA